VKVFQEKLGIFPKLQYIETFQTFNLLWILAIVLIMESHLIGICGTGGFAREVMPIIQLALQMNVEKQESSSVDMNCGALKKSSVRRGRISFADLARLISNSDSSTPSILLSIPATESPGSHNKLQVAAARNLSSFTK
jgi:hypothetical protein